jgi:hypothetical protein
MPARITRGGLDYFPTNVDGQVYCLYRPEGPMVVDGITYRRGVAGAMIDLRSDGGGRARMRYDAAASESELDAWVSDPYAPAPPERVLSVGWAAMWP